MVYEGNDNRGKPKSDYLARIKAMTDSELFKETEHKLWLSAYASNNSRSDYHWHATACYDEWMNRNKMGEYLKALEQAKANCN
jgi:hypothetical protein